MADGMLILSAVLLCISPYGEASGYSSSLAYDQSGEVFRRASQSDPLLGSFIVEALSTQQDHHSPLFRALLSKRVPISVVRAMVTRYVYENELEPSLSATMIRMQSRGDDLTMILLLLRYFHNGMIQAAVQDVKKQRDDRVYIFQIYESCSCPFFYLEDGGGMKGLAIDVIEEVCRVAGKVCKFKLIYFTECLINDAEGKLMAGKGLFGRNFDACVGFSRNKEFENILSMSDSIWKYGGESQFFVKTGNPGSFDPRNITGKKIIFINSWQSTIRCLVEHKVTGADSLMQSQLVFLNGTQQLMDQFDKHKADAVFGLELVVGKGEDVQLELLGGTPKGLEPIGDVIHCAEGVTISSRKDSSVTEWFNDGLRKIKKSGKYAKICREAEIKHGKMGQVDCEL